MTWLAGCTVIKKQKQKHNILASKRYFRISNICDWRRKWPPTPTSLPEKTPWTEEPGRLQSMGLRRIRYNLVTEQYLWIDREWDKLQKRVLLSGKIIDYYFFYAFPLYILSWTSIPSVTRRKGSTFWSFVLFFKLLKIVEESQTAFIDAY